MIKDIISFSKSKNLKKKEELEEYIKEIEKLQKMTLRLLEKNLESNILDETFNIKNAELKEKIEVLREKIYSIKNITKINEEELREYLKNFKESANDYAKRKVIESFVQEIRVYGDKIKIAFRNFLKTWIRLRLVEMTRVELVSEIITTISFYKFSLLLNFVIITPVNRAN